MRRKSSCRTKQINGNGHPSEPDADYSRKATMPGIRLITWPSRLCGNVGRGTLHLMCLTGGWIFYFFFGGVSSALFLWRLVSTFWCGIRIRWFNINSTVLNMIMGLLHYVIHFKFSWTVSLTMWIGFVWSRLEVTGSCEHGSEPSGFIKIEKRSLTN